MAPEHAFALVLLEAPLKVVILPSGYAAVVWREGHDALSASLVVRRPGGPVPPVDRGRRRGHR